MSGLANGFSDCALGHGATETRGVVGVTVPLFSLNDPHSDRSPAESANAAEKWCAALPAKYIGTPLTQEPVTLLLEQADAIKRLERELRRELWLNHGHGYIALYGDDGEMQCGRCLLVDFKRDSIEKVRVAVMKARNERIEAALRGD